MSFVLPTSVEEWFVKGTFVDVTGNEVYIEMPAVFIDGVLDEAATNEKINTHIDDHNEYITKRVPPNNAS